MFTIKLCPKYRRRREIIRELKPVVVLTFYPIDGYRHPDHIAIHNATVKAFQAAGDPKQYPEAGPAYKPQKLYFSVFSRRLLKIVVKLLPLFGQNPHKFGRNKDIDIASLAKLKFPVDAIVRLSKQTVKIRDKTVACYLSQADGGSPRASLLGLAVKLFGQRDLYMRTYPPGDSRRETDLFHQVV